MSDLYDTDFHEWAETQAALLRQPPASRERRSTGIISPRRSRAWRRAKARDRQPAAADLPASAEMGVSSRLGTGRPAGAAPFRGLRSDRDRSGKPSWNPAGETLRDYAAVVG